MKFKKIGKLQVTFKWSDRYKPENKALRDQLSDLEEKSKLIKVTFADGETQLRTEANVQGGLCDCCKEHRDPVLFEFFK